MASLLIEFVRPRRAAAAWAAAWLSGMAVLAGPAGAVIGGSVSDGALARSAVMVLSSKGGVCSAVVVAPTVVLTAAHCASGAPEHRVHYKSAGSEPVLLQPADIAVHPGYDRGAVAARRRSIDLALVLLPGPLPATFLPATLTAEAAPAGSALTLGGYGVLAEGDARSTGTFREAALDVVEPYGPSRILVWLRGSAGAGACGGDSGGPIAGSDGAVAAVTTWASGTGRRGCGAMSQGVLVGPQRAWIDATLARWSQAPLWR